jgi:hypothetical protein
VNLSLGEYSALVAKAFRGAGYSWGLTEEASFSARRLAESGFPTGDMVVRLLRQVDRMSTADVMPDARWTSLGPALCSVCLGTSIADLGGCGELSLGPTVEPLFVAPFLSRTLGEARSGYVIEWEGGECAVSEAKISVSGDEPVEPCRVVIRPQEQGLSQVVDALDSVRRQRVELREATMAALEAFAHRVYAPATAASRIAGAGAGLTDND